MKNKKCFSQNPFLNVLVPRSMVKTKKLDANPGSSKNFGFSEVP
jgi:hypothetical protein